MRVVAREVLLGLCCGALAIDINAALLGLFDRLGLKTAHGGLLRLLELSASAVAGAGVRPQDWERATSGPGVKIAFHIGVGLVMAVFYVVGARRWPPRGLWANAMAYALAVWLLNASIVLPLIGEGFAGSHTLTLGGMIAFAIAHTTFFLVLAGLFSRLGCAAPQSADGHACGGSEARHTVAQPPSRNSEP